MQRSRIKSVREGILKNWDEGQVNVRFDRVAGLIFLLVLGYSIGAQSQFRRLKEHHLELSPTFHDLPVPFISSCRQGCITVETCDCPILCTFLDVSCFNLRKPKYSPCSASCSLSLASFNRTLLELAEGVLIWFTLHDFVLFWPSIFSRAQDMAENRRLFLLFQPLLNKGRVVWAW